MPSHRSSSSELGEAPLAAGAPEADAPGTGPAGSRRLLVLGIVIALLVVAGGAWFLFGRGDDAEPTGADTPPPVDLASALTVEEFGAVGDGTTDDTEAVQAALDAADPGQGVLFAEGATYAVDDVLTVTTEGVVLTGGGTLLATDEQLSSLTISADDVVVQDLTLAVEETSQRWDAYEQQRLRLDEHSGIVVRDVRVTGSAAAGIYVGGTTDFVLDAVEVSNTRADGIHMTQGASDGRVLSPLVRDVGDDGVAVVSYAPDGDPCARIEVVSPVVEGSDARGVSVVGGEDVTFTDIQVSDTAAAGVYIAAEGSYDTAGVSGVRVEGGTVTGANTDSDTDHGAVLVFNGTEGRTIEDVEISGLELRDTREDASRWVGLLGGSGGAITDVQLTGLALDGDGPGTLLESNEDSTDFTAQDWTRDGEAVEDEESSP